MSTTAFRRRAVFLDVDGTIMQDGRYIPPSAVEAIRTARANGHLVFFSTGRGTAELRGELSEIGVDGAVTNGGGFASVGDEIIVSRLMTPDAVDRLEREFRAHGIHWYFQTYDRLFASDGLSTLMAGYVERDRLLHAERARAAGVAPDDLEFFSVGMKVFDDPEHFAAAEVAKAVILGDDADEVAALLAELDGEFAVVGGTIPLPDGGSGEIASAGVNKGATILELLAHLGIDAADAIGIGDNWNDVEMFEVCGLSIAMGNAAPGVQALADEVTTAIDDDGIRNAFRRHGLV
jgi:Cof subfamily protein (haloacid dehalogenase superfamily)